MELGYDVIDYNADEIIGFSTAQVHLRNGHRVSASKAFLTPIRDRLNFHLSKLSRATRILVDRNTKTAVAVEFIKNGKTRFVYARKEIILSAGNLGKLNASIIINTNTLGTDYNEFHGPRLEVEEQERNIDRYLWNFFGNLMLRFLREKSAKFQQI